MISNIDRFKDEMKKQIISEINSKIANNGQDTPNLQIE